MYFFKLSLHYQRTQLPFSIFVDSKLTTGDSRQEMFQAKMLNPQSPKVGPQYERRPTNQTLVLLRRLGYYILGNVKKVY
jgi:hypothetical protein